MFADTNWLKSFSLKPCRYLKKGKYATRVGAGAPVYLAAVLEYLAGVWPFCCTQDSNDYSLRLASLTTPRSALSLTQLTFANCS